MSFSEFWYKQNMFFVVKNEAISHYPFLEGLKQNSFLNVVHPDLFLKNAILLQNLERGKKDLSYYFKLLVKALLLKVKILKR